MTDISIPAGALEAGMKHYAARLDIDLETCDEFTKHQIEHEVRLEFNAMVGNWEGMRPYKGSIKALVLPLEPARDD